MTSQARSVKALQLLLGSSGGPDPAGPHQGAVAVAGHATAEVRAEQQLSQPPPRCGQGTRGRSELPSRRASPSDPVITSLTQPPAPWSRSELSDSPPAEGGGTQHRGQSVRACRRAGVRRCGPEGRPGLALLPGAPAPVWGALLARAGREGWRMLEKKQPWRWILNLELDRHFRYDCHV